MGKQWYKSKTVWTGISGVVAAVGGFFTGSLDVANAIQIGLTSLLGVFLRTGISSEAGK